MRARLPQERVEEHRLADGHVRAEIVVLPHVRHAVLETGRTDRDPVDQDVAMEFHLPGVERVGQDVAEGGAFTFC